MEMNAMQLYRLHGRNERSVVWPWRGIWRRCYFRCLACDCCSTANTYPSEKKSDMCIWKAWYSAVNTRFANCLKYETVSLQTGNLLKIYFRRWRKFDKFDSTKIWAIFVEFRANLVGKLVMLPWKHVYWNKISLKTNWGSSND